MQAMPAPRSKEKAAYPKGLYAPRDGYFVYRSPVSGRTVTLGKVTHAEAFSYANWANQQANIVKIGEHVGRTSKPHDTIDSRGLLEARFIAEKAMVFDSIAGVYFLLKDDDIVYIGRSTNILVRLNNHRIEALKDFNRIFVIECPVASMDRMERLYIDKFKPRFNAACPPVRAGDATWSESVRALLGSSLHISK